MAGAWALGPGAQPDWDWQPAAWPDQAWRAWTAAWVHWNARHLAMNAAALVLLLGLAWRARFTCGDTVAWALAWPLTHLGLLLQPGLQHYGGLSGVLHAGAVLVAWRLCMPGEAGDTAPWGAPRLVGGLLAIGLVLKLLGEGAWHLRLTPAPELGFAIAPLAHASGALAGLVAGGLIRLLGLARSRARLHRPTLSSPGS